MPGRATRYHEAGHATAGLANGHIVERITIHGDDDASDGGAVDFAPGKTTRGKNRVVKLAGPLAEAWSMGKDLDLREAEMRDIRNRIIKDETDDDLDDGPWISMSIALADTAGLLFRHWPAVVRIAEALPERGTLSGARAKELFDGTEG